MSGKVYVAGTQWLGVGDVIEGFEWSGSTEDDDLDALAAGTPGPMSLRFDFTLEKPLSEEARRILMGARWCYAHPRRLAINGSEYNRRRRNR